MKHVEFYSKNKFEKLVHLVGFIVRIYGTVLYIKAALHFNFVCVCVCVHAHMSVL